MKNKNLLKLLASVALVFSLAACNGPKKNSESSEQGTSQVEEPKVITIAQAIGISFDSDAGVNVADNEGLLATVENLTFAGDIGDNRILCQYADDPDGDGSINLVNDLYGVEVELKEGTALVRGDGTTPLGYTDKISVTGRVTLEDGRKVVLKDASYTYVDEGSRRNWYIPMDRSYLNNYFGRAKYNGACAEATFQVLEVPTITENGGTLKLVFPGEKPTLEDNDFLFELKIPGGLDAEAIAKCNEMLKDVEVGGGFYTVFLLHYRNGMQGVLPLDFVGRSFSNGDKWQEVKELEGVYTDYADVLTAIDYYADASIFADFTSDVVYSYVLDTSMATQDFSEESYCYVNIDTDIIGRFDLTQYTDDTTKAIEDVIEGALALELKDEAGNNLEWFIAAWFDENDEQPKTYADIVEVIFLLGKAEEEDPNPEQAFFGDESESESESEEEDPIYAEVIVDVSEGLLSFYMFTEITLPTYVDVDSSAEAVAVINELEAERAAASFENWATAIPEDAFDFESVELIEVAWASIDAMASYGLAETEVYVVPADGADTTTLAADIYAKIAGAGFVLAECGLFESKPQGLWNESTGEFIMVGDYLASYGFVYLDILLVYNPAFFSYFTPVTE